MIKPEIQKVNFTYKFLPGVSASSHGIYVATKAGLDKKVIEIATRKATEFNDKLGKLVKKVTKAN